MFVERKNNDATFLDAKILLDPLLSGGNRALITTSWKE